MEKAFEKGRKKEKEGKKGRNLLQFPKVIAGLVVAAYEERGDGSDFFTRVILVESVHLTILWGTGKAI